MPEPIPMRIPCPGCSALHVDEGEFATKPHHTHSCQSCGLTWRPAVVHTVGVRFLPGFKNEAKGEPQAAEPPEPRPIVVGSKWRFDRQDTDAARIVSCVGADCVRTVDERGTERGVWGADYPGARFRAHHTWLSDPEPAAPAPDLPRKVEPGTTLTVGARYRVTEIASWDEYPEHRVGYEFTSEGHGCSWSKTDALGPACWVLECSTYVTGLELVADGPKGESK